MQLTNLLPYLALLSSIGSATPVPKGEATTNEMADSEHVGMQSRRVTHHGHGHGHGYAPPPAEWASVDDAEANDRSTKPESKYMRAWVAGPEKEESKYMRAWVAGPEKEESKYMRAWVAGPVPEDKD